MPAFQTRVKTAYLIAMFSTAALYGAEPVGIAPSPLSNPEPIQALLDRGDRLVYVPAGEYTIDKPLRIPSDVIIWCERPGVTFKAAHGAFKATGDVPEASMVIIDQSANVEIHNCTFKGLGVAYLHDPANGYTKSEFRHCLRITGATNVNIRSCTFKDSGGDGVYVGPAVLPAQRIAPSRINLHASHFVANYRNGVSVVAGEVTIDDCVFAGTNGTSPNAGIDFEPATANDAVKVTMRRCVSAGNRGPAYAIIFDKASQLSPPSWILIEDCEHGNVPADQSPWRLGSLLKHDIPGIGLVNPTLPKGTFVKVNGVVLVDKKQ